MTTMPLPSPMSQTELDARLASGVIGDAAFDASIEWPTDAPRLDIRNCRFAGVSFRQAILSGASFSHCRFHDCSFRSADLSDARFERCQFYDPDTQSSCDFSYADLRNSSFD